MFQALHTKYVRWIGIATESDAHFHEDFLDRLSSNIVNSLFTIFVRFHVIERKDVISVEIMPSLSITKYLKLYLP